MALDKTDGDDEVFHDDGLIFVMEGLFLQMAKPIAVDLTDEAPF